MNRACKKTFFTHKRMTIMRAPSDRNKKYRQMQIVKIVLLSILIFSFNVQAQEDKGVSSEQQNILSSKKGWNHYGPGYFVFDDETLTIQANGGMGLFWYSKKKYSNFILELDYMSPNPKVNSGIFLRIPEVPVNNNYVTKAFEVQINDNQLNPLHRTGAVYDAIAASHNAFKPMGEWNHMKITFVGNRLFVELNGEQVIDWNVEPRGKVVSVADMGYIGLQNHHGKNSIIFKNIFVKELD
ncbi:MAG: DUF1080 domain-containing protein [Melioribacteraceae bacterium]|nr:DUF1080 domain-containing protein [Melioribacteraceae bacterium]